MGELQGRTFGGYQLLDELGGGGVAEVYRARQVNGGGREVVVKVIYKEFARQPGFARNFAYVTEASTRLASHPHILPLVTHGEENEYLYLVTPYVQAGTLADWIAKGGRLGAADVGPFFQQLCGALSYAHSLGVVHGNLKPSNIFLHEGRHILLGDFGLLWDVRALDHSWSGSGVEAFEFLAPEVFDAHITQAGDIYSLGATLFHSLTGHSPFHMDKLADLIAAAQQQSPPSLGQQQPPLAPPIAALDPVVAQAMAKRPEERFASAGKLAQTLDATLRMAASQYALAASQPQGQPQWQAMPSAPVSAGVFNAPAVAAIAPVFGAPPAAAGALVGLLGTDTDSSLEHAGAALANMPGFAPGASQPMEPPTMRVAAAPDPPKMRVPSAPEPPTMRVAVAPSADAPFDFGLGGSNGALPEAGSLPTTAPRMQSVGVGNGAVDEDVSAMDGLGASGLLPLDPPDALLDANIKRISQRLPAVGAADAAAQSGTFSPTELGLPRLTNPALQGNLPQDWQDLLTDESARRRHDPFAGSNEQVRPAAPTLNPSASDSNLAGSARSEPGSGGRRDGWAASDPMRAWEAPRAASSPGLVGDSALGSVGAEDAGAPPRSRRRKADYDIDDLRKAPPSRSRSLDDDFNDTMQEQRVWTNSRSVIRIRRGMSAAPLVVLLLAMVALVELAGFAVARPDVCVTHACAVVAGQIQKFAPNLQIPGAPAPISFAPSAVKVSASVNGSGVTSVTLTNTGSRAIGWSATTTLGWLKVSPASGTLAKGGHTTLTLTAQPDGVTPGSYNAGLVIKAATGQSATPVTLTVTQGPVLAVTTSKLSFSSCGVSQPLNIANTGSAKLSYTATPSQADALSVSPSKGALSPGAKAALSVTLSCAANQGQSYAVIIVSDGGSAQTPVSYGG
ncbi:MAG TPA: protein kinase [Ktedonobacterales bacterium]|jgi:serine/threonine-protein kinase|nr:protein kinase [Ktedonobacterales bacterium]